MPLRSGMVGLLQAHTCIDKFVANSVEGQLFCLKNVGYAIALKVIKQNSVYFKHSEWRFTVNIQGIQLLCPLSSLFQFYILTNIKI